MTDRKQMHLQDLFRTGREVKFEMEYEDEPVDIVMWMRKPLASQQDEALNKARGKQARRKTSYKDKKSDIYLAFSSDLEAYENIGELKEQLLQFETQTLRSQAFNDILYNEEFTPKDEDGEPIWGEDNTAYLDLLVGIQGRMEEIDQFNEDLGEGDEELRKSYDTDEELVSLQADRDKFESHTEARYDTLAAEHIKTYDGKKTVELRKILLRKLIEADVSLVWYEEYRMWMLYFACRDPEDKTQAYFSDPTQLLELPPGVIAYLENELEDIDKPGNALKNLPSLQHS